MGWLKRGMWRAATAIAGLLLLLILTVWVPASAGAYDEASGLATLVTIQAAPTVDVTATMTALNEEKLRQEIQQLKDQNGSQHNWLADNSTALIAAVATVVVALFGILQWAITVRQAQDKDLSDRKSERQKEIAAQDKELNAQAEERFKTAVTALGDEKEGVQVGGAILLRSFLNKEDEKIYGRYYIQIFDLAVAYLRLSSKSQSQDADTPLPLTPLRLALIVVLKEAFPLARSQNKERFQFLDASRIKLDNAHLREADLAHNWMPQASFRRVNLRGANLKLAYLAEADFREADLGSADFSGADLIVADLSRTSLRSANFSAVNLSGADFTGADLGWTILVGADLSRTSLNGVLSLEGTDLRSVTGLTREQLEACKAKGAIIDEEVTTTPSKPTPSPAVSAQSNKAQPPSAPPAQASTPPASTDGSSSSAAQPSAEP